MTAFSNHLQKWYKQNRRTLPWRETDNAYSIWLSEIIMQQTRVDQGMEYYLRFISLWPDIFSLSKASEQEVLKQWQGLGYYSRARNLLFTAKQIVEKYNGRFPQDYNQLLQLKGVGSYTAAAIASIAFRLPYAVVDGNVNRVLTRYFGIEQAIDSTIGKKEIENLAAQLLDVQNPGNHNQALMEFGALYCVPILPDCINCIFSNSCEAKRLGKVKDLPLKQKKIKTVVRYFNYFICEYIFNKESYLVLNERQSADIWQGLYDFPMIETKEDVDFNVLQGKNEFLDFTNNRKFHLKKISELHTHILTHQKLKARFYHLQFEKPIDLIQLKTVSLINKSDLSHYPIPRLIDRYLQNNGLH